MRALFWILALFAAAVGLTLAARYDTGYVLLVLHPWRIELSLNLLVLLLLLSFFIAYALLRATVHTLRLPSTVRAFREQRRLSRARDALLDALRAFFEGRFARAEQAAAGSLALGENLGMGAVVAARAAHELKAFDKRDGYLATAARRAPDDAGIRLIAQAELLLDERRHEEALAALKHLPQRHTAAMRLELKAQQMAKNWERVLELVPQLQKRAVFDSAQADQIRRHAYAENLKRKALDAQALTDYWQKIPAPQQRDSTIAAAAAQCFMALGGCKEAHQIIEQSLESSWDTGLIGLYSECLGQDVVGQIERAEAWLTSHPGDAILLYTLGRLCAKQRLWGKAQSYLEASISVEASYSAHMALAQLLEGLGRMEAAREHYHASLDLAVAQLKSMTGGRRRSAL
jgi:HemY protein